jgi:hypothetical protein
MKKLLLIATLLWFTYPAQASPITWHFFGTTTANSVYNNMSIVGLSFELRIFLDSNLVGTTVPNLSDVFFNGPHQGVIEISGLGVLPLNPFNNVQYFAPGGLVTGVQYNQPFFSDIQFPSSISNDSLHITPIAPVAPGLNNSIEFLGPNGLNGRGAVSLFSATAEPATVPEGGSASILLFIGLVAIKLVRRRIALT